MKGVGTRVLYPSELGASEIYDLLAGSIVPRPIALVSSHDGSGATNLAPFSFFMPGGVNPPSLAFSATLNAKGEQKDTLANIQATREFTVNVVDRAMAEGMNRSSAGLPRNVSEWAIAGFSGVDGIEVGSCRIAESPCSFECRLFEIVKHGDGPSAAAYVIGEVVCIASNFDGSASALRTIGRLGGAEYIDLAGPEVFEMHRP